MRLFARPLFALAALVLLTAAAADPADRLANPTQEARARSLFRDVKCLVCQSESIDESEAPLARDIRQLIRGQVAAGRSDTQIRAFLVSRYGEFVLLTPRVSWGNALLWLGPLLVVVVGAGVLIFRSRREQTRPPLSNEEEAKLSALLHDETT